MSSAKRRIAICKFPTFIPKFCLFTSATKSLMKSPNNVGDKESPCLTPLLVSNQSVYASFSLILAMGLEYRAFTAL